MRPPRNSGRLAAHSVVLWVALVFLQSLVFLPLPAWAQPAVAVPTLTGRVVDLVHSLSSEQKQSLEARLQAFEQRKGSQIAVLIIAKTQPETIEQYAIRVAEQWQLGRKRVDDGAILLIAKEERALRIEVGYGLEGALSDAICKRVIDEQILPRFRQGDVYGGISAGIDAMMRVVDGEALPPPQSDTQSLGAIGALPLVFIAAIIMGALMRKLFGRGKGAFITAGALGLIVWFMTGLLLFSLFSALMGFVLTLSGFRALGGWRGGGGGGDGGDGGRGGGGFRGGGGGFGGGGASGRW